MDELAVGDRVRETTTGRVGTVEAVGLTTKRVSGEGYVDDAVRIVTETEDGREIVFSVERRFVERA